jgi:hypothetical protein
MIYKLRNLQNQQAIPVPEKVLTVGRDEASDVPIDDESVSRSHAHLYNEAGGLFVEDAGSSNGTRVRNQTVTGRVKIEVGDIIHFGLVQFRLDPEVPGENTTPTVVLKPVLRPSLKRPTAKLPPTEEPDRNRATAPVEVGPLSKPKVAVPHVTVAHAAIPHGAVPHATGPVPVPTLISHHAPMPALAGHSGLTLCFGIGTGAAFGIVIGLVLQKFVLT